VVGNTKENTQERSIPKGSNAKACREGVNTGGKRRLVSTYGVSSKWKPNIQKPCIVLCAAVSGKNGYILRHRGPHKNNGKKVDETKREKKGA